MSVARSLTNVAWYERGARGFWLMLTGFAAAFLALGLLPPELIEAPRARAALGASPVGFFFFGFLCPEQAFARAWRAALAGALCGLAAALCALWAAGTRAADLAERPDLALSGLAFCAALGLGWGAACRRSGRARPRGQLAYVSAEGSPDELASAGALAMAELGPDWAQGAAPAQEGPGSWRVDFPKRPGFFLAVESQEPEPEGEGAPDSPDVLRCLLALALEPGRSPAEWLGGHASGLDPMALRPAFCVALERASPGCRPQPLG